MSDDFAIYANGDGDILVTITGAYDDDIDNPLLVYDGGSKAAILRNMFSAVTLDIAEEVKPLLSKAEKVSVIEVSTEDLSSKEYSATIRMVKSVNALINNPV